MLDNVILFNKLFSLNNSIDILILGNEFLISDYTILLLKSEYT